MLRVDKAASVDEQDAARKSYGSYCSLWIGSDKCLLTFYGCGN